jgi:hypothetical protein
VQVQGGPPPMKHRIVIVPFGEIRNGHRGPAKFVDEDGLWTVRLTNEDEGWFAQALVEEAPIKRGAVFTMREGQKTVAVCLVL